MSTRLMLTTPCDEREGHAYHLRVEESSGSTAWVGGTDVLMPWLRAACSCGWVAPDEQRFTLEENAHHAWLSHLTAERLEAGEPLIGT